MVKRRPLHESEDFDPQAVEQLREQLNLPTVKPNNPLTVQSEINPKSTPAKPKSDRPKKINIDIGETRHNRLNELAAQIRSNNDTPVAPAERMYPIHLIQMAIDHLLELDIDWKEVRKPDDLKVALNQLRVKRLNR